MSSSRINRLWASLQGQKAIKAISGIANFDMEQVATLVRAATQAQVAAIDVSAKAEIVQMARENTDLPLFASCINPENLAKAVEWGADAVELGNYDGLYAQGLFLSHEEVLNLAAQTMARVQGQALVCVTIPGHLNLSTQIQLAHKLKALGVDLIQTEGASRILSAQPAIQVLNAQDKAALTLINTRGLVVENILPVMSASGIDLENITRPFELGAVAVGVGSAVNQLASEAGMVTLLEAMKQRLEAMQQTEAARLSLVS